MILLSLSLFLQYDLLQCVEFEKVDFNSLIRRHNENSFLRNNTPAAYQLDPITPEYAFFTPPDTFRLSPTIPHQTRRSQNIHDTQHKFRKNYFKNIFSRHRLRPKKHQRFAVLDISQKSEEREKGQVSQDKSSSYNSREHDTSESSSSESEQNALIYNPATYTSENSYQKSKEKAADDSETSRESGLLRTRRRTTVSPAMRTRGTEETTRHKRLKPHILLPITLLDGRNPNDDADFEKTTPPRIKYEWNFDGKDVLKGEKPRKGRHEGFFGNDNDILSKMMRPSKDKHEVMRMHAVSKHTKTMKPATIRQTPTDERFADNDGYIFKKTTPTRSKHKLNVNGNDVLWRKKPHKDKHGGMFGDDRDIFKMMKLRKHRKELALRMHLISDTTKKEWYSDRMIVEPKQQTEQTTTSILATKRQPHKLTKITKHNMHASSTIEYLRAPLSKKYFFKIMEHRREGYMIVFLIELIQIFATKDAYEAHDIVKHADPIIQRQSKQLLWMGHPFLDVTRKFATMLKVTDIASIQVQAANMYQKLLKRHEKLPAAVNTILEYAETMYDDDEGKALFDALRELVTFPKIPLSGYWLCNSLINAFLRPFRRLKDTQQLKELMVSINLELKKQDPSRLDEKQPLRSARGYGAPAVGPAVAHKPPSQKGLSIEIGPQFSRPRPKKRKRKHHHRHHKRKRDEERLLFRPRTTKIHQRLTLTSVTPRTTFRWLYRDTTYPSYLLV